MPIDKLFKEIESLSPAQRESVFSFVFLLKHPGYLQTSWAGQDNTEPFGNEREALDFANHYAERTLRETR
ncbi:MAG: hypothetical protein LBL50_00725 [Candidatus Margulisbacteria bacterium]|jgi:hypothetical protein|nr:hypothetical protein [Candidatus Margulisiibacteriota bacterium]